MKLLSIWFVIYIIVIILAVVYSEQNSDLVAVIVLFRHGDRSPIQTFPNDPYFQCKYFPMGFGQLTKYGVQRAYKLGQWFRERYNTFLSSFYVPTEIYIWSTNTDRTLMTATSVLAGMYPPQGYQLWNEKLLWQPIPVHTVDRHKDDIITERRPCPAFQKLVKKITKYKYPLYKTQFSDLFQHVAKYSGFKEVTVTEVEIIRNVLYSYNNYNTSFIPDWMNDINMIDLEYLSSIVYAIPTYTIPLARLRIGPFFNYIINYFNNFTKQEEPKFRKFLMMSGHDTCIVSILDAMAAYDMRHIGFCDVVIFELKKIRTNGKLFINVLLKQEDELYHLRVFDCNFSCLYEDFKKKMSNIVIDINQWQKECAA